MKVIPLRDRFVNDRAILDFIPLQDRYTFELIGQDPRGDQPCDTPTDDNRGMSEPMHRYQLTAIFG